mmetsp:Transcript_19763/g.54423  ORF Transcript_19763/g.54423 Transcript_19763/m.54423 type:complete len:419 (+) Transcript_19763:1755-3011(+)
MVGRGHNSIKLRGGAGGRGGRAALPTIDKLLQARSVLEADARTFQDGLAVSLRVAVDAIGDSFAAILGVVRVAVLFGLLFLIVSLLTPFARIGRLRTAVCVLALKADLGVAAWCTAPRSAVTAGRGPQRALLRHLHRRVPDEPEVGPRRGCAIKRRRAALQLTYEAHRLRNLLAFFGVLRILREGDFVLLYVDVHRIVVDGDAPDVGAGRVDDTVPLRECAQGVLLLLLPVLSLGLPVLGLDVHRRRARVGERLQTCNHEVADSWKVCLTTITKPAPVDVAVDVEPARRLLRRRGISLVLPPQRKHVWMALPPRQDGALLHGDEPGEVLYLQAVVAPVLQAAEVEQLGPLVDLGPEAALHCLLYLPQLLSVLEAVQVREDANDSREAVILQDIDELEGLQLEAERRVDEQQHEVCHLG